MVRSFRVANHCAPISVALGTFFCGFLVYFKTMNTINFMRNLLGLFLIVFQTLVLADVKLPAFFADHAVLQRDRPLPIWGWADPGESVSVSLGTQTAKTVTGPDGRWIVRLTPQPASKHPLTLTVSGKNTVTFSDMLLGDVWLCSGQSNMSLSLGGLLTPDAKKDQSTVNYPLIRQFGVVENFATTLQTNVTGEWLSCTPAHASRFCAVGFYFACKLHAETGVPIGIMRSAKGSTTIELWLSQETILNTPELEPYAATMRKSLTLWEKEKAEAAAKGIKPEDPAYPPLPFGDKVRRPRCVTLYNGMIHPLAPMALRGVIWYQGESNAGDKAAAQQYTEKLRALINSWRQLFDYDALPFYIVQLPNYRPPNDSPAGGDPWSYMREAQSKCLTIPHTSMIVTIDIGEAEDIHPKNKYDVGERLARAALKNEYGKTQLTISGPVFHEMKIEENKIKLIFDSVGSGLMTGKKEGRSPAVEDKTAKLNRFAIAGEDKNWVWADAIIEGDTVIVSSPKIKSPVAVRYAFSTNPTGANLYNRDGLPAAPFRTDNW